MCCSFDPGELLDKPPPLGDDFRHSRRRASRGCARIPHIPPSRFLHRELELAERPRLEGDGQRVFAVGQRRDVGAHDDHRRSGKPSGCAGVIWLGVRMRPSSIVRRSPLNDTSRPSTAIPPGRPARRRSNGS